MRSLNYALFCCKELSKRESTEEAYYSFELYRFLRALQQYRAQSRLLHLFQFFNNLFTQQYSYEGIIAFSDFPQVMIHEAQVCLQSFNWYNFAVTVKKPANIALIEIKLPSLTFRGTLEISHVISFITYRAFYPSFKKRLKRQFSSKGTLRCCD